VSNGGTSIICLVDLSNTSEQFAFVKVTNPDGSFVGGTELGWDVDYIWWFIQP
jgi:hypothetical protein